MFASTFDFMKTIDFFLIFKFIDWKKVFMVQNYQLSGFPGQPKTLSEGQLFLQYKDIRLENL